MRRSVPFVAITVVTSFALGGVAFANHDFDDVPTSSPFHDDISWMADNGIGSGFPDNTFHPTDPVTRQAVAAFLHRMSGEGSTPRVVDAAELEDRTAADFDNAVSLQGNSPEELQPEVYYGTTVAESTISGTSTGTATTIVTTGTVPAGTYLVNVTGAYRTTWEEAIITCFVAGGTVVLAPKSMERVHNSTEENLNGYSPLVGTAVIDVTVAGPISARCYWNGLSGVSGTLLARPSSITALAIEDV